jgi:hypothetical protein
MSDNLEPDYDFELVAPAQAHGEEIRKLTLRPIRAEDIAACGYPFTVKNARAMQEAPDTTEPEFDFHAPAIIAMTSRLAGVPRSTVAALSGGDLWKLGFKLLELFFISAPAKSSTRASTSPGPGDNRQPLSLASASRN